MDAVEYVFPLTWSAVTVVEWMFGQLDFGSSLECLLLSDEHILSWPFVD